MEEQKNVWDPEEIRRAEAMADARIEARRKRYRKHTRNTFILGCLSGILVSVLALLVTTFAIKGSLHGGMSFSETQRAIRKLDTLTAYLENHFMEEVDVDQLLDGAYAGLVSATGDKYSHYFTPEEYKAYLEDGDGSYIGIGVTVSQDEETGYLKIVEVKDQGPAQEAGIKVGDLICIVDGTKTQGMTMDEVVKLIKGKKGTTVEITVDRDGETMDFTVERRAIETVTVHYKMLDDHTAYLQITEFDDVTMQQFRTALDELLEEGMESLVLDLRNNPGGRLDVVVSIADRLLPECLITYTEEKDGTREEFRSDDGMSLEIPMVVLVNGGSASASEVLTGALQDQGAATIVGTQTYGKGIVQCTYGLYDGSAIKVTMAKYFTPSGRYIHGVGITPDVEVELLGDLNEVRGTDEDNQLKEALDILH